MGERWFVKYISLDMDIKVIKEGDGKSFPKPGDKVTVHYIGTFPDGKEFDSSVRRGSPFVFTIGQGQVIRGWDEGVAKMSIGQKAKLSCPPDYAYGKNGVGGIIPPNATLNFEVELLKINWLSKQIILDIYSW